jgi:serine protease Do
MMRRHWMAALGALVLVSLAAGGVRAADEDAKGPRRRVEVRMAGGGGQLGVSLEDVGADDVSRLKLSGERGAVVTDVRDGSAAEKAGIREGDVIVRFGGQDVWSASQLARLVRETPAGRVVDVGLSRDGSSQSVSVTLAKPDRDRLMHFGPGAFHFEMPDLPEIADIPHPPVPPVPPMPPLLEDGGGDRRFFFRRLGHGRRLGLSYQEMGEQLAGYFKVEGGVLVTEVEEDGPAAKAGVKAGDVIVRFGGKAVKDGGDLRSALADAEGDVAIGVQRDGRAMDLTVKIARDDDERPRRVRRRGART